VAGGARNNAMEAHWTARTGLLLGVKIKEACTLLSTQYNFWALKALLYNTKWTETNYTRKISQARHTAHLLQGLRFST